MTVTRLLGSYSLALKIRKNRVFFCGILEDARVVAATYYNIYLGVLNQSALGHSLEIIIEGRRAML